MADNHTKEVRSMNMSHIRSTGTKPEETVRKFLFSKGLRYRKNVTNLPGKPDIVLPKYKTVVFIHGCYWHRHLGCKYAYTPKTNTDFWEKKFAENVKNDAEKCAQLKASGWSVITLWECDVERRFEPTMEMLVRQLRSEA